MRQKRRVVRVRDEDLTAVVRHWESIPGHARRTFADLARSYGAATIERVFPTPKDTKWEDVSIVLVREDVAQITVGEITRTYSFEEMKLTNARRRSGVATNEGRMLRVYA